MQEQKEETKNVSEETKQRFQEIHNKLEKQSKYYRVRASVTLGLIIFVTIVGLWIFAFPNFLVHGNSSRYDKLIYDSIQRQKSKDSLSLKR